jgi:FkbM family methyltransferase
MTLMTSAGKLLTLLAQDYQLSSRGAWPGWYTFTYYRGRWQARRGGQPSVTCGRVVVNRRPLQLFVTAAHLATLAGVFLHDEYDLRGLIPGYPKTILDLGANVGMAAAYLHAHFPEAGFICVEPDQRNLPLLHKTIAANRIQAQVVPAAISAEPGRLRLRVGDNPTCSALETSPMHQLDGSVEVTVTTVPRLMAQHGWESIDLIKIDIEGAEVDLLSRNNHWLSKVGAIILEIHPNTTSQEIGSFLSPFGFTLAPLNRGIEPVFIGQRCWSGQCVSS